MLMLSAKWLHIRKSDRRLPWPTILGRINSSHWVFAPSELMTVFSPFIWCPRKHNALNPAPCWGPLAHFIITLWIVTFEEALRDAAIEFSVFFLFFFFWGTISADSPDKHGNPLYIIYIWPVPFCPSVRCPNPSPLQLTPPSVSPGLTWSHPDIFYFLFFCHF